VIAWREVSLPRLGRAAPWLAAVLAVVTLAVALRWSTFVVGGSDSYCYVSQAAFWLDGSLRAPQPVGFTPPWPNAAMSLTPTGYVPSPTIPGAIAPLCPAGLSLTMVPLQMVGGPWAVFLAVPMLGALAVWLVYCLGRELGGPATGLLAAVLLGASPIVLHQIVQPMSDVPAMTWWLAALVLVARPGGARAFAAGLAASAAILTRPNLAPLAGVVLIFIATRPRPESVRLSRAPHPRAAGAMAFALGVLPGVTLLAWIQRTLYGSPFSSGYGPLDQLFSWSHILPNLQRYPTWLLATHTPVVCLAVAAPFVLLARARRSDALDRQREASWLAFLSIAVAGAVVAAYLVYIPYDDWWYLRFLLPAMPPLLALTAVGLLALRSRLPAGARAPAGVACSLALVVFFVWTASARGVFQLPALEARFRATGRFVADRLPERAVVLSVWQSGSVRYYGGRLSILFDQIDPAWLDRALSFLAEQGRLPYLVLETWEEPAFKARFQSQSPYGALDWPPMAQVGTEVRIYDPAARARYFAGEPMTVERVWPGRPGRSAR